MAEVFVAVHTGVAGFERPVCVKRILPVHAADAEFRKLFVREATIAGGLSHANIVQVFDAIEDRTHLAIVMELIDGLDLRDLLLQLRQRGVQMSESAIAYVAGQVLLALRFAHRHGVVHRDVSPHNLLVSRHGEVKLADFGVAKAMLFQATRTGELKGKLAYMSPEQARGEKVDFRSDLYSLGLVLYELSTQQRFFEGESQGELFAKVARAPAPDLGGISSSLGRLLGSLLAPDSAQRFASAEEAIGALPPWTEVGPAGALELTSLLSRVERSSPEMGAAPGTPTPTPAPSSGESEGGTDVLPSRARRGPERPVVPGDPNAPTATREDDVEMALALAPTSRFQRGEPVGEHLVPPTQILDESPVAPPQPGAGGRQRTQGPSRSLLVVVLLAAVFLILVILLSGWLVLALVPRSPQRGEGIGDGSRSEGHPSGVVATERE